MSHKPQLHSQSVGLSAKATINLSQVSRISKQNGSALVIGVFIITVMFLLAAALINVLNDADQQISVEVWGTRALAAANSGADKSLAALFPVNGTSGNCAAQTTWNIGSETGLVGFHGCEVVMTCSRVETSYPAPQENMTQYLITSTATCSTGECDNVVGSESSCIRVSRQVEVEARD
ncbi:MSHA biogenesis protein MshP [Shewanella fidelis]|uniref:MSHA biogenesis protein MshP n=1 Tax=Shewanella fidelis TaxID=173509 RepID=A0AAW8NHJ0_9GAMM|nr:MSHA biogenesis protein MshP [Shewanella fidelis]MDR8522162.1 MSHA biogenesis protein MshP [Shewanella fidelis]MDW4812623.1 MSHA biogenesis protein MshP [Shewanella fidelis]MDW4816371.1 MSHA biogenesis protein MshP [Shewanella fidelis]MDW4820864.1 MSHA biogenesis protein MshP [Shewanella fidelis]MDW4825087.1 MSHA biogenesis protein MshP [Shewanella fidelis]